MNFPLPFKLRHRTLVFVALITALLVAAFVSGGLSTSFAETAAKNQVETNNSQSAPQTFLPSYAQTNFVSDLPGMALFEDRQIVNPWGVALNSSGAFWVVDSKIDRATVYRGDVGDVAYSPVAPDFPLTSVAIPNVPTLVPAPSQPTGVVANTTNDFVVSASGFSPLRFTFCLLPSAFCLLPFLKFPLIVDNHRREERSISFDNRRGRSGPRCRSRSRNRGR